MVMAEDLQCLKVVALQGALPGPLRISSQALAERLAASPQTASRRLQALERDGLLTRTFDPEGQVVTVSPAGEEVLRQEYADYARLFHRDRPLVRLTGTLITGLGEGRYYMSLKEYCRQFRTGLGFIPYPGTLNLRLSPGSIAARKRADALGWVTIQGFSADNRTFGDVKALPCRIRDIPCGIIVPGRTHYPGDILEVIAPVALREALSLADGDEVVLEIGGEP